MESNFIDQKTLSLGEAGQQLTICPDCAGSGEIENQRCPRCLGAGIYFSLGNYLFTWSKSYTQSVIYLEKFQRLVKNLINAVLILICLIGLVALFFQFYELSSFSQQFFLPDNWHNFKMLVFWLSLPFASYLIYRYHREEYQDKLVLKKDSITKDSLKQKKIRKVEISQSFSTASLMALERAYYFATLDQQSAIQPIHLFAGMLENERVKLIFARLGIGAKDFQKQIIELFLHDQIVIKNAELNLALETLATVQTAYLLAMKNRRKKVDVSDLMEALVTVDERSREILYAVNVDLDKIKNVVAWIHIQELLLEKYLAFRRQALFKPKGVMNRAMTALATPFLDFFSEDLTQLSRAGYLNLCVARDKEIEEIYRLFESGQSGALLVGYPGTGKTNIIEGLANNMVAEEVPALLQDKRFVSLSLAKLIAGAEASGELEERVMKIMTEITRAGNIILFIDNIHNLVGAASVGTKSIDLSEVFGEFLKKYNVLTVATTTPQDYVKYIENNPLGQIFEKVNVPEPDVNSCIQILEAKAGLLEKKSGVYFAYEALEKIVQLSKRYISERYLPEKAIVIMEEAAEYVRKHQGKGRVVTGEDVAALISAKTNVPLTQVTQSESKKLLNLEKIIHQRLVDQDEAVNFVANALRRARAEIRDPKKPIVNLLFLGPTGVGKTELAKTVAEVYFGDENKMIRLDMSEYQNKDSLDRLIGTTDGQEAGFLSEAVRKNPFSLLLLDELEKAHADILNVFLQVMDDGRLTDNLGRTIDFTNIILIATSNASTDYIQKKILQGFALEKIKNDLILNELKTYFRPEFLNRFNGIVVFKPLSQNDIIEITKLQLKKLAGMLEIKGIRLEATTEAINELAQAGFDPIFGARPLKRVIQEKVDNALANFLLTGKIGRRDKVILEKDGIIRIEEAKSL